MITNSEALNRINRHAPLTDFEDAHNKRMNKVRARVEHAVAEHVEGKQMFQVPTGTYRGNPELLEAWPLLCAHANSQ
jgi:hypothetical protein